MRRGSQDNISAVVVLLPPLEPDARESASTPPTPSAAVGPRKLDFE